MKKFWTSLEEHASNIINFEVNFTSKYRGGHIVYVT